MLGRRSWMRPSLLVVSIVSACAAHSGVNAQDAGHSSTAVASGQAADGPPPVVTSAKYKQAGRPRIGPPSPHARVNWAELPATIHRMPRPGIFAISAWEQPAYYSVWDQIWGLKRPSRPKSGYAPFAINAWPFYDADWRYVESTPVAERTLVESLKRIHVGDRALMSTGGEFWVRYNHEHNSRLTEIENDFSLAHVRLFGDLSCGDGLRVYGEYIWAESYGATLPPVPPDEDRGDILDLFVDLKLGEFLGQPIYVRGGRQELLFGSQRMVTPLPWANKRHSFDGVKIFRHGDEWDFAAFWAQFVPPRADRFDTPDENRNFAGAWLTHKLQKGEAVDFYYLLYDNENSFMQQGIARAPFQAHTLGSRWAGDRDGWLWDFEGALQFGSQANSSLFAGMATAGLGRDCKDIFLSPTVWLCYDYASGDNDPADADVHTYNQLFPFGHYYLGWMDLVGRQNIHDVNAHVFLDAAPWLTVWLQYHRFWLAQRRDALYNAGGVPYRRDPSGAAGRDVGDEIDLVLNFHLTRYSDVLVSYNKLYGGGFLQATSAANQAVDAETLYLIFQQRW